MRFLFARREYDDLGSVKDYQTFSLFFGSGKAASKDNLRLTYISELSFLTAMSSNSFFYSYDRWLENIIVLMIAHLLPVIFPMKLPC